MKKILFICLLISTSIFADSQKKFNLSIGGGVSSKESFYLGTNEKKELIPFIYLVYKRLELDFSGAKLELIEKNNTSIKLLANFNSDGYKSSDSVYLNGLSNKEGGILGGIEISKNIEFTGSNLSFSILANNNGKLYLGEFTQIIPFSEKLIFIPKLKFKYMESKYATHYFGISSKEKSGIINMYTIDNSHSSEIELMLLYLINNKISLMSLFNMEALSKEIKNSPIINNSNNISLKLIVTYTI